MFRLNRWQDPQDFVANPFDKKAAPVAQDIKQVWFAGVHADIGGGYPEQASGPAKYALDWMIREAVVFGLKVNRSAVNYIVLGRQRVGGRNEFQKPSVTAPLHDSLSWGWRLLECLPKRASRREWPRRGGGGLYLPLGERRSLTDNGTLPRLHVSVIERKAQTGYAPPNLPKDYVVEA